MKKILLCLIITFTIIGNGYTEDEILMQDLSQKTPRIVGGREADPDSWEWMVAIVYADETSNYNGLFCGGALIHPKWVVTAGHCAEGETIRTMEVVAGIHDLKNDTGERIKVKRIISHPSFDSDTLDSDIALLELEHEVSYAAISPVSGDNTLEDETAVVTGWGSTNPDGWEKYPADLQEVYIPIVSNQLCQNAYKLDDVTETMICAGYAEGGKDACYGDSGGPLMVWQDNTWRLAGLVSWGEGCAEPGYYGVYTRVSKFTDFIYQYVPILSDDITGDFNRDGRLGMEDIIGILQILADNRELSSESSLDFSGNGNLGIEDAVGILQILNGN